MSNIVPLFKNKTVDQKTTDQLNDIAWAECNLDYDAGGDDDAHSRYLLLDIALHGHTERPRNLAKNILTKNPFVMRDRMNLEDHLKKCGVYLKNSSKSYFIHDDNGVMAAASDSVYDIWQARKSDVIDHHFLDRAISATASRQALDVGARLLNGQRVQFTRDARINGNVIATRTTTLRITINGIGYWIGDQDIVDQPASGIAMSG